MLAGDFKEGRYLGKTIPKVTESDNESSDDDSVKSLAGSEIFRGGETDSRGSTLIVKVAESIRKASELEVKGLHRQPLFERPASEPNPKITSLLR